MLRTHIQEIADDLLDRVQARGRMDVIADFAAPMPAIVTAEMLGVPTEDHADLKNGRRISRRCSETFSIIPTEFRACSRAPTT